MGLWDKFGPWERLLSRGSYINIAQDDPVLREQECKEMYLLGHVVAHMHDAGFTREEREIVVNLMEAQFKRERLELAESKTA